MKKTLLNRIYIGAKKVFMTPTLPENILIFQSNPFIRIFRVLGGLSILILLIHRKNELSFNIFIIGLLVAISFLFFIYNVVIFFYRVINIIKILNSDELGNKNLIKKSVLSRILIGIKSGYELELLPREAPYK